MSYPVLQLKPKKEISITRRHPWVFSGALTGKTDSLKEGEKVQLADTSGTILATGHFGGGSIAMRILEFAKTQIDVAFYTRKLGEALALRKSMGLPDDETDGYRLVHGEGDGLPGLIIDVYAGIAVVQSHSRGIEDDFPLIEDSLQAVFGKDLNHVVGKSANAKGQTAVELPDGAPGHTEFKEYGHTFTADWARGQKTGFFLDQRENRKLVSRYSKGRKVLNAFCYTGGFSIYALHAKAVEVHSIDSSKKAMDQTEAHISANGFEGPRHRSITADAMKYLAGTEAAEEAYDLIILDPPAFAKHRSARHAAVQAYKRLNAKAFEIAAPGSIVFTFSCSQVVSPELFNHTIAAAAMESGRNIRILHHLHQPADHPVSIFHPEGEYLKGLVLFVG